MDKPKKFLFDLNDFSNEKPVQPEPEEEQETTYAEEDLTAAREESFRQGQEQAAQTIRAEQDERRLQCLESVTRTLNDLVAAESSRENAKNHDTVRLTLSIAKKLMPSFSRKFAEEEIISLVRETLSERSEEPRLAVIVHDSMLESLRQKIDDIAGGQAFQGKVVIIADDTLNPTDCRIEWADGGIEKDFNALYSAIENAFHTLLHRHDDAELPSQPTAEDITPPSPDTSENDKE